MRLQDVLDEALDILMHSEFKTFGDLQKARYQNNKSEDELWIKHDMYANTIQNPETIEKNRQSHLKNLKTEKGKHATERGRASRRNWYKDPKNKQAFLEKIRKREQKRKFLKEQAKKN